MGVRFFKLTFELLSPAIVGSRVTARGFKLPLSYGYVPGTTLRGALLSSLFREGLVDEECLASEAREPRLVTSCAYPISKEKRSFPCHPFAYRCKIPHGNEREIVNYVGEILADLEQGRPPRFRTACSEGHTAIEPLHPKPVIPRGRVVEKVDVEFHFSVCVGISKHRGTAERGMLFEYEALASGQKFWASAAVPDELADKLDRGLEFSIGRGISRGFGRAALTGVEEVEISEEAERARRTVRGGRVILLALSPLLSAEGGEGAAFPRRVDLASVAKRCGLSGGGSLEIEAVYGRAQPYAAGWDMARNEERPTFSRSALPGSVVVAKVSREFSAEALAALGFAGTVESALGFALPCVNVLTPLRGAPDGRW